MRYSKQIECAVAYGMGYVCGKHNIKMSKKEIKQIAKKGLKVIAETKTGNL